MAPTFWRPARIMVPVGRDTFQMKDRADRLAIFRRDAAGRIRSVRVTGLHIDPELEHVPDGVIPPVERLVHGEAEQAVLGYRAAHTPLAMLVAIANRALLVPSLAASAEKFASALTGEAPDSVAVWNVLGDAAVAAGHRDRARQAYGRAASLDSANAEARDGLMRLGTPSSIDAVHPRELPFSLRELFAPPTAAEIGEVRQSWSQRDLAPQDVEVVGRGPLTAAGATFELWQITHRVHGKRHYGVVLVPAGAAPHSKAVLVEARGVSWNFAPLSVPGGLTSLEILGERAGGYVIAAPAFRGESMIIGADTLRCEGDPDDSWDGSTDDLLAMLNVVLQEVPAADPERIEVFGRSRGGSVAMLAGERDPRIRAVAAWAAPADWFESMSQLGWSVMEQVADGLWHDANRRETGGQFLATFLNEARAGRASLADVRRRMIASSPRYFAASLPPTEAHYGLDDAIVPPVNGRVLESTARGRRFLVVRMHANAGHDQDLFDAPRETRRWLLEHLRDRTRTAPAADRSPRHQRPRTGRSK